MLYALFLILILSISVLAQGAQSTVSHAEKGATSAAAKAGAIMLEKGGFTIELPASWSFEETTPTKDSPKESGGKYSWDLPQGVILIFYSDDPQMLMKSDADFKDMQGGLEAGVAAFGGKISSRKEFSVAGNRGYSIDFTDPAGVPGLSRMIVTKNRTYTIMALARDASPATRAFMTNSLDSFRPVTTK